MATTVVKALPTWSVDTSCHEHAAAISVGRLGAFHKKLRELYCPADARLRLLLEWATGYAWQGLGDFRRGGVSS